jgi:hypothetical protein
VEVPKLAKSIDVIVEPSGHVSVADACSAAVAQTAVVTTVLFPPVPVRAPAAPGIEPPTPVVPPLVAETPPVFTLGLAESELSGPPDEQAMA